MENGLMEAGKKANEGPGANEWFPKWVDNWESERTHIICPGRFQSEKRPDQLYVKSPGLSEQLNKGLR